jgi:hypothetical protein
MFNVKLHDLYSSLIIRLIDNAKNERFICHSYISVDLSVRNEEALASSQ